MITERIKSLVSTKGIKKVVKRNGETVPFKKDKVAEAIKKAAASVSIDDVAALKLVTEEILAEINKWNSKTIPAVEEIQDLIENTLIKNNHAEIAKAYILYREQRSNIRDKEKLLLDISKTMDGYLDQSDWRVNENSNINYSLGGLILHNAGTITANYWLNNVYPKDVADAHRNGDYHIHDMSVFGPYCAGWSLRQLLEEGFGGVLNKITSKPAKHLSTLVSQMVNFLGTLQNEWAGAQAFSSFDTYLAPFVRVDNLTYKDVKQQIQSFIFGINTPSRWGSQAPFTNITLDWVVPTDLKDYPVIIGGKSQDTTYGDYQVEMDIVNKAFLEVMLEGDAEGRGFAYPIPTYNITKDFNWDHPNSDLLFGMAAKYGTPYFQNFINSTLNPVDVRSMCPLAATEKVLIKSSRGRGLEYVSIGNIVNAQVFDPNRVYEVYSDGKFVEGRFQRYDDQQMLRVTLENNHQITMSKSHLNFVRLFKGEEIVLEGAHLKDSMYLPYSLNSLKGEGGDFALGLLVGAFAGDGSLCEREGGWSINLSLNKNQKTTLALELENICKNVFGALVSYTESETSELLSMRVNSQAVVGLVSDFVDSKGLDKSYKARVFGMSEGFRRGVLDGHTRTDGNFDRETRRIYSSSPKMVECLNMLASSLGTVTSVYEHELNRESGALSNNSNYCVTFPEYKRDSYGNRWFKADNKLWMKIKYVEEVQGNVGYCLEVLDDEPMFTVGTTGILTHNCRLQLDKRELRNRGGGLFGADEMTGSIGVVTINLARIGYLAKTRKEFLSRLDHLIDLASESLTIKRKVCNQLMEGGLYPYTKRYLGSFKNHFNTIGINGMNEALLNFMEKDISDPKAKQFAKDILNHMRTRMQDLQEETGDLYNLEATPAESTSYRLAKIDKDKYPNIICSGTCDPYYTNSTQLPVGHTPDIFEALDHQDDLQTLYTGGTVLHGFLGERLQGSEACKKLVKKILYNYHIPYLTISPTFSICPTHGYLAGEHFFCPKCEQEERVLLQGQISNLETELEKM